jgi:transcriptional regulator with XRE-family HTH domain
MPSKERTKLAVVLTNLRERAGLSRSQLAKKIGVSSSYLSMLENSTYQNSKSPSLDILRQLYRSLSKLRQSDAFDLIQAILETNELAPAVMPYGGLTEEAQRQLKEDVQEVWIISDLLGENVYDKLFEATYNNILKRNVSYVYFLPFGSDQWPGLIERFNRKKKISKDQLERCVTCIECPPLMSLARIALFNPREKTAHGTITLGSMGSYTFFQLEKEKIESICKTLLIPLQNLTTAKTDKALPRTISLPSGRFELVFPK